MTRRRWIADQVSGNHACLVGAHAEHLARVLRAKIGQEFDISTGSEVRRGHITSISPDRVEFELGEVVPSPASAQVTLVLSIFKFDRMEWAIEKCTELGAARMVPVIARRTEARLAAAAANRVERWRRIAQQAAEQSRQVSPPEIAAPIKLKDAVALSASTRIVLSEAEEQTTIKKALQSGKAGDIVLAFGPEGGWTESELELFRNAGWISASLGNTVLRAETAAIAAMAIVLAELRL
ncbi:MAG TPA: 16S rRNA (uracil(1498)-N(3))-methyltransferase [Terriglobales bacterium]|nr:16S rRNA (uracil(1498)-N(3))-methyltransferase [Terriglobales bacterium]